MGDFLRRLMSFQGERETCVSVCECVHESQRKGKEGKRGNEVARDKEENSGERSSQGKQVHHTGRTN